VGQRCYGPPVFATVTAYGVSAIPDVQRVFMPSGEFSLSPDATCGDGSSGTTTDLLTYAVSAVLGTYFKAIRK